MLTTRKLYYIIILQFNKGGDKMTNAEKVFAIRKSLGMSRKDFGHKLGVSEGVITNIEIRGVELKPLMSDLICRVYNVNPIYMKTGEGEMFISDNDKVLLDEVKQRYKLTDEEVSIVKSYLELDDDNRKALIEITRNLAKGLGVYED